MKDITQHGDNELSLQVQNDEYLYKIYMRAVLLDDIVYLMREINELFIFTDEQFEELEEDFLSEERY